MAIFDFTGSNLLGLVIRVDTRQITIHVKPGKLRLAKVGGLTAVKMPGAVEQWLIAVVDRVTKSPAEDSTGENEKQGRSKKEAGGSEGSINTVRVILIGTIFGSFADAGKIISPR